MAENNNNQFTLKKLQDLMRKSAAFSQLDTDTKQKIQQYIKQNNKPALMYLYHTLLQEEAENRETLDKLNQQLYHSGEKQSQKAQEFIKKLKDHPDQ